jgi:hypothetical protein
MEKIFDSFGEVDRDYGYAKEYMERAKASALKYIKVYVAKVHSVGLMVGDKPALLTLRNDNPVYYTKLGCSDYVSDLPIEAIYDVCKQLKQQHLVKEWGDPDFDDVEPEQV